MKSLRSINLRIRSINRSIVAMLALVFGFTACVEPEWTPYKSSATISSTVITYQTTTLSGKTNGDPAYMWRVQVIQGSEFCSIVKPIGAVGSDFQIRFEMNNSEDERSAEVKIDFTDGYSTSFTIRQLAKTKDPDYDHTWGEQPAYREGVELMHKTYYTTLMNGQRVRNYSICYDMDKLCSHWVAYPMHSVYMQRGTYKAARDNGRTDAWAYDDAVCEYSNNNNGYIVVRYDYTDPVIPQSKQWPARTTYGSGYARGHILPSASRYNTFNTNAQTFYSVNIMPQEYDFNGGSWVTIENKVRGWVVPDTLFVVTGTLFEGAKRTVSKSGVTATVPSHAYKLLLRTKAGNTKKHLSNITSADELQCIAFLYENNESAEFDTPQQAATTVAEIERRSGFKFFRNLNPAIADKVKSQKNLKDWGL